MTDADRDLLERAARAAGYEIDEWHDGRLSVIDGGAVIPFEPLTDDGDALRLAVKLRLDIDHGNDVVVAGGMTEERYGTEPPFAYTQEEREAATRRAIVRAAAAMAGEE